MRHRGDAEPPPQPQSSPSNSLPHRKKNRKRRATTSVSSETSYPNGPDQLNTHIHHATVVCQDKPKPEESKSAVAGEGFRFGELRQRSVNGRDSFGESAVTAVGDGYVTEVSSVATATSERVESLELKRVLANDSIPKRSPVSYVLEKLYHGNSVWSTTTIGDEKGRERVYDTIFRLPWRCELLIDVGFFVCFNSFLSLLTIMPMRIAMTIWRLLKTRKFKRPSTIELSDFGCFLIMACGVIVLQQIVQAITLSACIVSHYNALPALLVSNNFAEIKSYVFKGYSRDNVHSMVYSDSIERFHISAFILFVLAQNILEAEGPWFGSFISNILLVYLFEMGIDIIKHSFIAKFNNIAPIAYSEFLEVLCKQTLHMQTEGAKKKLTFVPLAPACVVIRVLAPVYAANLPYNPLRWRLFWILLFSAITYIMLTSLKVLIGMVLQKHARWYVNRCQRRKQHLHAD
ncbi:hypothetical protein JHK85_019637 [Glycine max]|nr:hypothetical protein JHK85_019637 [Glycine max]KAG5038377.1 hypothetical protein JHK86_019217 [Glycine max]